MEAPIEISEIDYPLYKQLHLLIDSSVEYMDIKGNDLKIVLLDPPYYDAKGLYQEIGAPYVGNEVIRNLLIGTLSSSHIKTRLLNIIVDLFLGEELHVNSHVGVSPFPSIVGRSSRLLNMVYRFKKFNTQESLYLKYHFKELINKQDWSEEMKQFILDKAQELNAIKNN